MWASSVDDSKSDALFTKEAAERSRPIMTTTRAHSPDKLVARHRRGLKGTACHRSCCPTEVSAAEHWRRVWINRAGVVQALCSHDTAVPRPSVNDAKWQLPRD